MEKDYLFDILKKELEGTNLAPAKEEVGRVVSCGDGVVQIEGLPNVVFSEMVEITRWPASAEAPAGKPALILNLEEYTVGAVILGDDSSIKEGDLVRRTGKVLSVPAGEALLGRGEPLGNSVRWERKSGPKESFVSSY